MNPHEQRTFSMGHLAELAGRLEWRAVLVGQTLALRNLERLAFGRKITEIEQRVAQFGVPHWSSATVQDVEGWCKAAAGAMEERNDWFHAVLEPRYRDGESTSRFVSTNFGKKKSQDFSWEHVVRTSVKVQQAVADANALAANLRPGGGFLRLVPVTMTYVMIDPALLEDAPPPADAGIT